MRFIGYTIENFKAIEDEILIEPLKTLNVVIGPNNEGKSSIFEPLWLLKFLSTGISNLTADPKDSIHDAYLENVTVLLSRENPAALVQSDGDLKGIITRYDVLNHVAGIR